MMVLGFPGSVDQAGALAAAMPAPFAAVEVHRFPDDECRVRLPPDLPREVVFFCSLYQPDHKLVELMLAAATARDQGVERITLVAPYLCYMRQDKAFRPGEAVSQRVVGGFIASLVDRLVTVDPHLHRVATLAQAVPVADAVCLSASAAMGAFLSQRPGRPLLLGPDEESKQWVAAVAAVGGLDYGVARKQRGGDRSVTISLPERDWQGREVVLVDDMAATGRTLAAAAVALRERGARDVHVLVTHPLFAGDAESHLHKAGVTQVWSTDSIPHGSNAIALAPLLANALAGGLTE